MDEDNIFCGQVLWADESKIELLDQNDVKYVWKKKRRSQLSEKHYSYSEAWRWIGGGD